MAIVNSAAMNIGVHVSFQIMFFSRLKNNEIMLFAATWMDLGIVLLSEASQTEKEKHCMTSLYVESKKI